MSFQIHPSATGHNIIFFLCSRRSTQMDKLHPYTHEIVARSSPFYKPGNANSLEGCREWSASDRVDSITSRPMNLFFFIGLFFCAHLGVACVPVQRLVVHPHAFSHARLLHKKNYVLWGNRYDRTDNARKNCHRLSYRSSARGRSNVPAQKWLHHLALPL